MNGVWIAGEKLEACPCCGKSLDQSEYDFQWCRSCQLVARGSRSIDANGQRSQPGLRERVRKGKLHNG